MSDDPTHRVARAPALPVRSIRVEALEAGGASEHRPERLTIGSAKGNDLVLEDRSVSRFHAELRAADGGIEVADLGSTNGTWAHGVRIEVGIVPPGTTLTLGDASVRVLEGEGGSVALDSETELHGLLGRSRAMRRVLAQVRKVASSDAPVLVQGESGTGKELIATALHAASPRAAAPFVTVDCGSITPSLVASELFGHRRGAFTGAVADQEGAFSRAHGGTLFLDEIGELSESLQTSLLGVLERRRFRPLGAKRDQEVDVRVVAATHRELREEVNRGRFRLDLFYRIAVVTLRSPPLRERPDDIPDLIDHFLRRLGSAKHAHELFSPSTLRELEAHAWPGNVRELRNVVEASLAMGEAQLPAEPPVASEVELEGVSYGEARQVALEAFERRYLGALIASTHGNLSEAARRASMDRAYLRTLLKRHGLR